MLQLAPSTVEFTFSNQNSYAFYVRALLNAKWRWKNGKSLEFCVRIVEWAYSTSILSDRTAALRDTIDQLEVGGGGGVACWSIRMSGSRGDSPTP